jgi:hypothetical protein
MLKDAEKRFIQVDGGVILAGMTNTEEALWFLQGRAYLRSQGQDGLRYNTLGVKTNRTKDLMRPDELLGHEHVIAVMDQKGIPNLVKTLPALIYGLAP